MTSQISRLWQSRGPAGALMTLLIVGLAGSVVGCSFDGSLRDLNCQQEGRQLGEKVCRNGTWVRPDAVDPRGADATDGVDDTSEERPDSDSMVDSGPGGPDGDACTGGSEVCDGADNDCDGAVDEGCRCQLSSSEGVCSAGGIIDDQGNCQPPDGYVAEETDADCDKLDNDCDGEVDEECGCNPGETQSCYGGTMGSVQGICTEGTQTCGSDKKWGECKGEVTPEAEKCGDNKDSDCNGVNDNGCACDYKGNSEGVCEGQTRQSDGSCPKPNGWEAATDKESACDMKDNDCDGAVDEGCGCDFKGKSMGVCQGLTRDAQGDCPMPPGYDSTDDESAVPLCDSKDNDCDGTPDENCGCTDGATQTCGKTMGVCTAGMQTCSNGQWGMCQGNTAPSPEICNGKDDDCDGKVDENLTRSCGKSTGVCSPGTETCTMGQWGSCQGGSSGGSETCNNKDDDCDGMVDENLTRSCGSSTGACMPGTETCSAGRWGTCQGGTTPSTEMCNDQVDSDCNGANSNGCPCAYTGLQQGVCRTATRDANGSCQQPAGYEQTETSCSDGTDNDCDGWIDKNDTDCQSASQKIAGQSCGKDSQCLSGKCAQLWTGRKRCAHRMVVTSKSYTGKLGGASGADQTCQQLVGSKLGGTWKAIVAVNRYSPVRKIAINAPIYNTNGDKVADGTTDLWDGSLDNAIEYDENGQSRSVLVWTATQNGGYWDGYDEQTGEDCVGWTSSGSQALGEVGQSDASNRLWSIGAGTDGGNELFCNKKAALYCIDGQ